MQLTKSYKAFLNTISYKAFLKTKTNQSKTCDVKAEALGAFVSGGVRVIPRPLNIGSDSSGLSESDR